MVGPIADAERLEALDVLRGLALFGVLIGNLAEFFLSPLAATYEQLSLLATAHTDETVTFLVQLLVENKANMMFGLLFGVGFALQIERLKARNADNWKAIYTRRLLVLMAFGVFQLLFFMPFDILHIYALAGLLLIPMRNLSDRTMLMAGLLLVLFGVAIVLTILELTGWSNMSEAAALFEDSAALERQALLKDWSYAYFFSFFLQLTIHENILGGFLFIAVVYALGRFMLGAWIARQGLHLQKPIRKWLLVFFAMAALPTGLAIQAYLLLADLSDVPRYIRLPVQMATVMCIVTGYGSAIILGLKIRGLRRVLMVAAPIGKMALTNYTVLGVSSFVLFFGPDGQAGNIGMSVTVTIGFMLFGMAIVLSNMWLRFFHFGPLEWAWRALTYLTLPPFRKKS